MKTDTRELQMLDQQLALSSYIDALLDDAAAPVPAETVAADDPGALPVSECLEAAQTCLDAATPLAANEVEAERLHPEWADTRFQALLFEVAGLTLAVPLVKLKGVVPNEQGCTAMPGHSELFLGVVPYQGVQSKVVDTARFVLPTDRAARLADDPAERMQHLIMIDGGRWALACSRIGDVIELDSDGVKWRGRNGKRLWLAGTVIGRMCALLDIDHLTRDLVDGMA